MRGYTDRTADNAISAIEKEWRSMANLALKVRDPKSNARWAIEQEGKFTGIFKRLLTDPEEEVRRISRGIE